MKRDNPVEQIRKISREENRARVHRAYLAEDYDGIGQFVLTALARSSTSSGLRTRVASGDFGTGQVIPVGTPVTVISIRGQLEIISMGVK